MILYWWVIMLICILIIICLFRYTDLKPMVAISIGILAFCVIIAFLPEVTIIKKDGDKFEYEKQYAIGKYKGVSTSFAGRHVLNKTNDPLVVYPSMYVDKSERNKDSNKILPAPQILDPGKYIDVDETPIYFFKEPNKEMSFRNNILDNFLYWLRGVDKYVVWTVTTIDKYEKTELANDTIIGNDYAQH